MRRLRGVLGTCGFARNVVPLLRVQFPEDWVVFIEDAPQVSLLNGHTVMAFEQFARIADASLVIAEPEPDKRRAHAERCRAAGLGAFIVQPVRMVALDDIQAGEGTIFSAFSTIGSNVRIGAHFHCGAYSLVEHDCVIGDFVTFAPSVCCNGAVVIGDGAMIGARAVIAGGVTIGAGAVIGMGAIVTQDVPPGGRV